MDAAHLRCRGACCLMQPCPHRQMFEITTAGPYPRQPHIGPQTYIGVMFADLFAKSRKIPTGCAFSYSWCEPGPLLTGYETSRMHVRYTPKHRLLLSGMDFLYALFGFGFQCLPAAWRRMPAASASCPSISRQDARFSKRTAVQGCASPSVACKISSALR